MHSFLLELFDDKMATVKKGLHLCVRKTYDVQRLKYNVLVIIAPNLIDPSIFIKKVMLQT